MSESQVKPSMVRIIDLFAGAGGLSEGFRNQGFEIALANEFDPEIAKAYAYNHPDTPLIVDDIRNVDLHTTFGPLQDTVQVIVGGPPCQGFSQKGQRKTINDERNYLFREFVEVVRIVTPKYFVMENVPNLLTAEGGKFRKELEALFIKLNYRISAQVLNAADFGVPQNRRRAIIIGKRGQSAPDLRLTPKSASTVWDAISDLSYLNSGEGNESSPYVTSPETQYQEHSRTDSKTLYNHVATRHSPIVLERLQLIPPNCTQKVLPIEHRTKSVYSGTWTRLDSAGHAPTITTRFDTPSSGQFTHPYLNRALTVREAARIQSFPDTYRFIGNKMSQMRQVGNAVPVALANAVAKSILNDLD